MARHPATVRIALTGHADIGMALRSITVCHQYVAKPCDGKMLKSALDGVPGLNSLLNEPSLIKAVGCVATLPADPGVFEAFETALTEAPVDPKSLADIVSQDPGLCQSPAASRHELLRNGMRRNLGRLDEALELWSASNEPPRPAR